MLSDELIFDKRKLLRNENIAVFVKSDEVYSFESNLTPANKIFLAIKSDVF